MMSTRSSKRTTRAASSTPGRLPLCQGVYSDRTSSTLWERRASSRPGRICRSWAEGSLRRSTNSRCRRDSTSPSARAKSSTRPSPHWDVTPEMVEEMLRLYQKKRGGARYLFLFLESFEDLFALSAALFATISSLAGTSLRSFRAPGSCPFFHPLLDHPLHLILSTEKTSPISSIATSSSLPSIGSWPRSGRPDYRDYRAVIHQLRGVSVRLLFVDLEHAEM